MRIVSETFKRFWNDEEGLGTLEIVLIVAVLVIIAIAFRKWIMRWLEELFKSADTAITEQTNQIGSDADSLGTRK